MQKIKNIIKRTIYRFQFAMIVLWSLAFLNEWLKRTIDNIWILLVIVVLYLLICQFIAKKVWGDNE
jgi:hypothetical protein